MPPSTSASDSLLHEVASSMKMQEARWEARWDIINQYIHRGEDEEEDKNKPDVPQYEARGTQTSLSTAVVQESVPLNIIPIDMDDEGAQQDQKPDLKKGRRTTTSDKGKTLVS